MLGVPAMRFDWSVAELLVYADTISAANVPYH